MSEEEFVKQGCRVWNDFSNLEMYSAVKEATGVYGVPPDVYSKMKDVFALERTLHGEWLPLVCVEAVRFKAMPLQLATSGNKYTPARLKTMCEVVSAAPALFSFYFPGHSSLPSSGAELLALFHDFTAWHSL